LNLQVLLFGGPVKLVLYALLLCVGHVFERSDRPGILCRDIHAADLDLAGHLLQGFKLCFAEQHLDQLLQLNSAEAFGKPDIADLLLDAVAQQTFDIGGFGQGFAEIEQFAVDQGEKQLRIFTQQAAERIRQPGEMIHNLRMVGRIERRR